jgi:glucan phosphoethanolaminetransferase (alkaline phosphatase superfamily)
MIQRIQSVYLGLVTILTSLLLIPFGSMPLAKFYKETAALHFYSLQIKNLVPGENSPFSPYFNWPLVAVEVLIVFFALIALFLYKNRKAQLLWIKINIFFSLILLGGFFFGYIPILERELGTQPIYSPVSFLPALILLFLVLAFYGVKKDEKLIKSMDRIR